MSEIIKQFYIDNNTPEILLERKIKQFEKHPDIAKEFEQWIKTKTYPSDASSVRIENYTAKGLADMYNYLDGEGAFVMLVELRDNPNEALKKIFNGFKWK